MRPLRHEIARACNLQEQRITDSHSWVRLSELVFKPKVDSLGPEVGGPLLKCGLDRS
jgi:hypothetical protein